MKNFDHNFEIRHTSGIFKLNPSKRGEITISKIKMSESSSKIYFMNNELKIRQKVNQASF